MRPCFTTSIVARSVCISNPLDDQASQVILHASPPWRDHDSRVVLLHDRRPSYHPPTHGEECARVDPSLEPSFAELGSSSPVPSHGHLSLDLTQSDLRRRSDSRRQPQGGELDPLALVGETVHLDVSPLEGFRDSRSVERPSHLNLELVPLTIVSEVDASTEGRSTLDSFLVERLRTFSLHLFKRLFYLALPDLI